MNREIIFRGKRVDNGEWIEGHYSNLYTKSGNSLLLTHYIMLQIGGRGMVNIRVEKDSVGQYTGLTDKNGVKIWEGDICRIMMRKKYGHQEDKLSNPIGFVEYTRINVRDDSLYAFDTFNINGRSIQYLLSMELEVIGNIHDNPELIK